MCDSRGKSWASLACIVALSLAPAFKLHADQTVLVSNYDDNTIQRYSLGGSYLGLFASTPSKPYGMAVDQAGNVFVALPFQSIIQKYSPSGVNLGSFASGSFFEHVEFDAHGDLYATTGSSLVRKFSPSGQELASYAEQLLYTVSLAFDSGNRLYVANNGPAVPFGPYDIHRFAADGQHLGVFASAPYNPNAIAIDAQDNLYVANYDSVHVFSPLGGLIRTIALNTGGGAVGHFGLEIDPLNRLLVADEWHDAIRAYSLTGADLGIFTTMGINHAMDVVVVPEPTGLWLLGIGGVLCWNTRRRKGSIPGCSPALRKCSSLDIS
jgi:sugar lactone lactonase YvrE